jgi:hypothetical protein
VDVLSATGATNQRKALVFRLRLSLVTCHF